MDDQPGTTNPDPNQATSLDLVSAPLGEVEPTPEPQTPPEPPQEPETPTQPSVPESQDSPVEGTEPTEAQPEPFILDDRAYEALGYVKGEDGNWYFMDEEDADIGRIVYRAGEDLSHIRKAIREKQRYITRTEAQLQQERERRERLDRELASYTARLTPDKLDELRLTELKGEELSRLLEENGFEPDTTAESIADQERREQFERLEMLADREAYARKKIEDAEYERNLDSRKEAEAKAQEEAKAWYTENVWNPETKIFNQKAWGVENTEERAALSEFLQQPTGLVGDDGKPINGAQVLYNAALGGGEFMANVVMQGLKSLFHEEYHGAPKPPKTKTEERVYESLEKKVPPASVNRNDGRPLKGDILSQAFQLKDEAQRASQVALPG